RARDVREQGDEVVAEGCGQPRDRAGAAFERPASAVQAARARQEGGVLAEQRPGGRLEPTCSTGEPGSVRTAVCQLPPQARVLPVEDAASPCDLVQPSLRGVPAACLRAPDADENGGADGSAEEQRGD